MPILNCIYRFLSNLVMSVIVCNQKCRIAKGIDDTRSALGGIQNCLNSICVKNVLCTPGTLKFF